MTTSWNPLFLNEMITKNYTSYKIKHRPLSELLICAMLDKVGGLGVEDGNRMSSAKPVLLLWTFFVRLTKQDVSRSKTQTLLEQEQHIRNTSGAVPLDFLKKSVQYFPDCRSIQNAGTCVEI